MRLIASCRDRSIGTLSFWNSAAERRRGEYELIGANSGRWTRSSFNSRCLSGAPSFVRWWVRQEREREREREDWNEGIDIRKYRRLTFFFLLNSPRHRDDGRVFLPAWHRPPKVSRRKDEVLKAESQYRSAVAIAGRWNLCSRLNQRTCSLSLSLSLSSLG